MNVIQIPGDPDPPTSFFLSAVSLIRVSRFYELLWRGDWFFSFRTRNTSGSAKLTNHKLEIRYPYTFYARRFVSIAGVIAIHLYFAFCNYIGAAKREEGRRRRRRRSKKKFEKKKRRRSVFFSPLVMNIFMNRRTFYITRWYTLLVRKRKNKRKRCNVETR